MTEPVPAEQIITPEELAADVDRALRRADRAPLYIERDGVRLGVILGRVQMERIEEMIDEADEIQAGQRAMRRLEEFKQNPENLVEANEDAWSRIFANLDDEPQDP